MKRRKKKILLSLIFVFALLLFIMAIVCVEIAPRCHKTETNVDTTESSSWMKNIDDEKNLSDITIPGIHDAGACNLKLDAFVKCQDYSIADLLSFGYRYVDLRLGLESDGTFNIYHSSFCCMTGNNYFGSALTLDSVKDDCVDFLKNHPTETILLVVKYEYGSDSEEVFETKLADYLEKNLEEDKILYTDSIPTLGAARGKIVLCRRYDDRLNLGVKSGLPLKWSDQGNTEVASCPYEKGENVIVQDRFKYNVEEKWNAFTETAEKTEELLSEGAVINFLSDSGLPYVNAEKLNEKFIENYRDKKIKGWIIIDFGNLELAQIIYHSNW